MSGAFRRSGYFAEEEWVFNPGAMDSLLPATLNLLSLAAKVANPATFFVG